MRGLWLLGTLLIAGLVAGCEKNLDVNIGALSATPGELVFGSIDVGLSSQVRVSLTNPSRSAVGVPAIKIVGDLSGELSLSELLTTDCKDAPRAASNTLAPGECARFTATWSPLAAHEAEGSIEIDPSNSNDPIILPAEGLGLSTAFPALRICALDETGTLIDSDCSDLGMQPPFIPTVDFGNGVPNMSSSRTVRLFNTGQTTLNFTAQPSIPSSSPPQFALSGSVPGAQLAPGASVDLALTATPVALGTLNGELDLATDDPRQAFVAVPLVIATTGIAICVAPAVQLSFGLTLIGTSPSLPFTLTNCGMDDVAVDSDSFEPIPPTTNQFSLTPGQAPVIGAILHPGDQLTSAVTYAPSVAQSDLAALDVRFSNGYGIYQSRVGLSGSAVSTFCGTPMEPTPIANIATSYSSSATGPFLPFDPQATPSPIIPLDYIQLSGAASTGATLPIYTWTLVSQPAGSTTALVGSGATVSMQTLVSGDYVVELSVAPDMSPTCAGTQQVTIHVVPTGDVHIELTWAESCGDVDLHYIAPGGSACGEYDTAYYNTRPDWGCATEDCGHEEDPGGEYPDGIGSDDASLDHDDQWGYGPENITQAMPFDSPADSPYQIWVYYYSPVPDGGPGSGRCGDTHPTINTYIGGILTNTFTLDSGLAAYALWHAADISVSSQGTNIQVIAGATASQSGAACGNAQRSRRRAGLTAAKDSFFSGG